MVDRVFHSLWTIGSWDKPIGESHIGQSHVSTKLPNQDSYSVEQWDEQQATFAAISDGHGSKKYWRSDTGSKLAVQALKELIQNQFLTWIRDPEKDPERLKIRWESIGKDLRERWLQLCAEDLYEHPFSPDENQKALNEHPEVIRSPVIVYGATLSGVLLFQDYGFFIHLGDGEIIGFDPDGNAESIFEEPKIKANDTASLCQPDAHRAIQTKVIDGDRWKQMRMIVLATDGVGDAFGGPEVSFQDHAEKYLSAWRKLGPDALKNRMPDETRQFSDTSGDDATLLLLKRIEKEDQLTRGAFEKAWEAFEGNVDTQAKLSHGAIKQAEKKGLSKVKQARDAALKELEELRLLSKNLTQVESRLLELKEFEKKTILAGSIFLVLILILIASIAVMNIYYSSKMPNAIPNPEAQKQTQDPAAEPTPDVAATGRLEQTLTKPTHSVSSVSWSPDGSQLASCSLLDNHIHIWNAATGQLEQTLKGHESGSGIWSLSWSPDGRHLASGSLDKTIGIWNANTGQLEQTLNGHEGSVLTLSWSPDGHHLASGSRDKTIGIWNAATGQREQTLSGHTNDVESLSWSPDGHHLASGSEDNSICIWNAATFQREQTLSGPTHSVSSVSWSPDGRHLASCSLLDKTIHIWNVATGQRDQTLKGHQRGVRSLSWSQDGRRLASGSEDKTIGIWNATTGQLEQTLKGHTQAVNSLSWSPDGRHLASGSHDTTIRIWSGFDDGCTPIEDDVVEDSAPTTSTGAEPPDAP